MICPACHGNQIICYDSVYHTYTFPCPYCDEKFGRFMRILLGVAKKKHRKTAYILDGGVAALDDGTQGQTYTAVVDDVLEETLDEFMDRFEKKEKE